jgi:hypothetical protein
MYFGNGDAEVIDLAAARVRARQERMKANRMATCGVCVGGHDLGASQLHRAECGMSWDAAAQSPMAVKNWEILSLISSTVV